MSEQPYGDFSQLRSIPIPVIAAKLNVEISADHKIRCPNGQQHKNGDRNPSISFFPRDNSFKCWVCNEVKGDAIRFAQIFGNIQKDNWIETGRFLAECIGQKPAENYIAPAPIKKLSRILLGEHIETMNVLMKLSQLPDMHSKQYLAGRKINPDIAAKYGVRCFMDPKRTTEAIISKLGADHPGLPSVLNDKGNLRFWMHRLVFPYLNENKDVVYIQGRDPARRATIKESAVAAPITLPWLPGGKVPEGRLWVCEGVIDALTILSKGLPAIAIPGARTWKQEWAKLLKGRTLILALDPDPAGGEGIKDILGTIQKEAKVIFPNLPEGKDLNALEKFGMLDSVIQSIEENV